MARSPLLSLSILLLLGACAGPPGQGRLQRDLEWIKAVGKEGAGNREAGAAARRLSGLKASALPALLAGMDGAGPLARNWLRAVVDAVAERALARGQALPAIELEAFVVDPRHAGSARRLAYEWLARFDPTLPDRVIPRMLDDPSVEMRRDAVQRELEAAEKLLQGDHREEARTAYREVLLHARDRDQVLEIAKRLEALGEKVDLTRHFGVIRKWSLVGPFDNGGDAGFQAVYPPEAGLDFTAEYQGKAAPVRWQEHVTPDVNGVVDLNKALGKHMGAVAYAAAHVEAGEERPVEIRAGSSNAVKVWLNGELLFTRFEYHHGMEPDQYRAGGRLKRGRNTVLLKVCQNEGKEEWEQDWTFQLRICDMTGGGLR